MVYKIYHHFKIDQAAQYQVPDEPMLLFPQIISLQQKYTHHVLDIHDVGSLYQFLHNGRSKVIFKVLLNLKWLSLAKQTYQRT